jgi:hypothetical protein
VRFTAGGKHLGSFGRFRTIRGIAVTPDGSRVYGADASTNRITVLTGTGGDLAEIGRGELRRPGGLALDGAGNVWVADRGNHRVRAFSADGVLLGSFGERGVGLGQFVEPSGVAVDCNGLVTVADADNNRVQQFQVTPTFACAPLPAVESPPDPILYNQPQPLPPDVAVRHTRTSGILAVRQFPLRVSCDLPCKVAVVAKIKPRSGKSRPTATLRFTPRSLPAGKTVTVRPRLRVADVRRLKRAMGSRRGLVVDLRVTATTSDSEPTVVRRRVNVTG